MRYLIASVLFGCGLAAATMVHADDLKAANTAFATGDYAKAQKLFEEAGYMGNVQAQRFLGNFHYYGAGGNVDKVKASYWYGLAGENGDVTAMMLLGGMRASGDGIDKSLDQARYWYQKAADAGSKTAATALAKINSAEELTTPQAIRPGFSLYQDTPSDPQTESGRDLVNSEKTIYFANGPELTEAGQLLLEAFFEKIPADNVELILLNGHSDTRGSASEQEARSQAYVDVIETLLLKRGFADYLISTNANGGSYPKKETGPNLSEPLNRRVEIRVTYYSDTNSSPHEQSRPAPASTYDNGLLAYQNRDYDRALEIWKPLAESGNIKALRSVGLMLEKGEGTPQDYIEAARYYQLAIDRNDYRARAYLGELYENGWGVEKNLDLARILYTAAASGGDDYGKTRLAALTAKTAKPAAQPARSARPPLSSYPFYKENVTDFGAPAVTSLRDNCKRQIANFEANKDKLPPQTVFNLILDCTANLGEVIYLKEINKAYLSGSASENKLVSGDVLLTQISLYTNIYGQYYKGLNLGRDGNEQALVDQNMCNLARHGLRYANNLGSFFSNRDESIAIFKDMTKRDCRANMVELSEDDLLYTIASNFYKLGENGQFDKYVARIIGPLAARGHSKSNQMLQTK